MRHKALLLIAVLSLTVVLAGCTGISDDTTNDTEIDDSVPGEADEPAPADDDVEDAAVEEDAAPPDDSVDSTTHDQAGSSEANLQFTASGSAQDDRDLITTGSIALTVDNASTAESQLLETLEAHDGYVGAAERDIETANGEQREIVRFVLRIPENEFDVAFQAIEQLGAVEQSSMDTEDVTDQLVDLDARLENLEAERDRLRELFEAANETSEVLAVQSELSNVQEEIERLEAEQRELQDRVAMSTLQVTIAEPEPEEPAPEEPPAWHEVSVTEAISSSVSTLVTGARAAIVAVGYAIPFLALLFAPLGVGALVYRRRSGGEAEPPE